MAPEALRSRAWPSREIGPAVLPAVSVPGERLGAVDRVMRQPEPQQCRVEDVLVDASTLLGRIRWSLVWVLDHPARRLKDHWKRTEDVAIAGHGDQRRGVGLMSRAG